MLLKKSVFAFSLQKEFFVTGKNDKYFFQFVSKLACSRFVDICTTNVINALHVKYFFRGFLKLD